MVAPGCTKRLPRSASTRPAAIFNSVDLPEPLRPIRQTRSLAETERPTPDSSGRPPKGSPISFNWSSGGALDQRVLRHADEVSRNHAHGQAMPGRDAINLVLHRAGVGIDIDAGGGLAWRHRSGLICGLRGTPSPAQLRAKRAAGTGLRGLFL